MELALRPYVTAGIAVVGASALIASPIAPAPPDIQVPAPPSVTADPQLTGIASDIAAALSFLVTQTSDLINFGLITVAQGATFGAQQFADLIAFGANGVSALTAAAASMGVFITDSLAQLIVFGVNQTATLVNFGLAQTAGAIAFAAQGVAGDLHFAPPSGTVAHGKGPPAAGRGGHRVVDLALGSVVIRRDGGVGRPQRHHCCQ